MAFAATLLAVEAACATPATSQIDSVAQVLHRQLDEATSQTVAGETVDAAALRNFYQPRHWRPAWTPEAADKVMGVLSAADQDGLSLRPLHINAIHRLRAASGTDSQAQADLLITDGVLVYASAMRGLRADPTQIEDDWFLPTPAFDAVAFLDRSLGDIVTALHGLQPPYASYQLLRAQLAHLRAVAAAGDWPKVPVGPTIKPGTSDERIPAIRKRLQATGELAADVPDSNDYDDTLLAAVQLFQQRHGLADDGALGRQTINAMNLSAAELARLVALNMERWRWLPPKLEETHIVVNVPAAWMEVVEGGRAVLSMRTVVGDPDHPTPAMHAHLTSLVLNPTWSVPSSIATNEVLPKLKKDPGYLVANDLEIVSSQFPPGSPESQGVGIDWNSRSSFPWTLRQKAGSDNALGRIKFNIPNNDDIYLHDTPNHKVFTRTYRALSHGCVRLDDPDALALYVLHGKDWSKDKLSQEIEKGITRTVTVNTPIGVWLLYWTTWVDGDGVLQVRPDIYGRDERLRVALAKSPRPVLVAQQQTAQPTKVLCDGCRVP